MRSTLRGVQAVGTAQGGFIPEPDSLVHRAPDSFRARAVVDARSLLAIASARSGSYPSLNRQSNRSIDACCASALRPCEIPRNCGSCPCGRSRPCRVLGRNPVTDSAYLEGGESRFAFRNTIGAAL